MCFSCDTLICFKLSLLDIKKKKNYVPALTWLLHDKLPLWFGKARSTDNVKKAIYISFSRKHMGPVSLCQMSVSYLCFKPDSGQD